MRHNTKYLWGSACILFALSTVSGLLLGYFSQWQLLVTAAMLAVVTFLIWRVLAREE